MQKIRGPRAILYRMKYIGLILLLPLIIRADLVNRADTVMTIRNMGATVNGVGDEFYPTITADGKTMAFSLRPKNRENSDIFISQFKDGAWTRPAPVREVNTDADEQTPFISADGNFLLFSSNREGAMRPQKNTGDVYYLTNDLYISHKEGKSWSEPELIEGDVNTVDNERAPSLSKDGKTLYFSRYAGNSLEKSVIYQATLGGGGFVDVKPMPAPINSGHSDFALMPSNNKPGFYFSSSRPGGRGLWDIYYVHYIDGQFSDPINLGSPTNSEYNDLTVTEVGNVIYFCSDRDGGRGSTDIYTITLSPKIFKVPDTGFKFSVVEKSNGRPVSASFRVTMRYEDTKNKKNEKTIDKKSDKAGRFSVKTDQGVTAVVVTGNDDGYMPFSKTLTPSTGEMKKVSFLGQGLTGYDNFKKEYFSIWMDSMSTGVMMSTGKMDADGKTLNMKGSMPDPITRSYKPTRSVETMPDANTRVMKMYDTWMDGKEYLHMEITYRRSK